MVVGTFFDWPDLGEARGEVSVPAGRSLVLLVSALGWQDLSPWAKLSPDAFAGIVISYYSGRNHDEARKHKLAPAGDDCLGHVTALSW